MQFSKVRKNQQQTHFEDLVLLGKEGLEELNDKIEGFISTLEDKDVGMNTTTKIDGAPAVFCWHKFEGYPDDSICLKSFVNNANNCMSSEEDIQTKYGNRPDMESKLKYCLELAKYIPSGEAWQGDVLYTNSDLKEIEIGGINYLTFQPNTLIYAFSEDNPTYEQIKKSDFGIAFHTIYKGNAEHKSQSFRVDASRLNVPDNFYIMSPALNISKNKAEYNIDEVLNQYNELKQLEAKLLANDDYEELVNNSEFMGYWNTFENSNLADKKAVNLNVNTVYNDLKSYVYEKQTKTYNKDLLARKTEIGKKSVTDRYNSAVERLANIIDTNKQVIELLVKTLNLAANIKMNLWNGLKKSNQGYKTFYNHKVNGYIPADMEGVAMSDQDGNIVKIVDRSNFSSFNRDPDIIKGFQHESLSEGLLDRIKDLFKGYDDDVVRDFSDLLLAIDKIRKLDFEWNYAEYRIRYDHYEVSNKKVNLGKVGHEIIFEPIRMFGEKDHSEYFQTFIIKFKIKFDTVNDCYYVNLSYVNNGGITGTEPDIEYMIDIRDRAYVNIMTEIEEIFAGLCTELRKKLIITVEGENHPGNIKNIKGFQPENLSEGLFDGIKNLFNNLSNDYSDDDIKDFSDLLLSIDKIRKLDFKWNYPGYDVKYNYHRTNLNKSDDNYLASYVITFTPLQKYIKEKGPYRDKHLDIILEIKKSDIDSFYPYYSVNLSYVNYGGIEGTEPNIRYKINQKDKDGVSIIKEIERIFDGLGKELKNIKIAVRNENDIDNIKELQSENLSEGLFGRIKDLLNGYHSNNIKDFSDLLLAIDRIRKLDFEWNYPEYKVEYDYSRINRMKADGDLGSSIYKYYHKITFKPLKKYITEKGRYLYNTFFKIKLEIKLDTSNNVYRVNLSYNNDGGITGNEPDLEYTIDRRDEDGINIIEEIEKIFSGLCNELNKKSIIDVRNDSIGNYDTYDVEEEVLDESLFYSFNSIDD